MVLAPYRAKDESVRQRESPDWLPHEACLLASPLYRLERISVIRRIETPVERFIDRALAAPDSHFCQISRVLHRIHTDYARDHDVASLARDAGMSVSAFH